MRGRSLVCALGLALLSCGPKALAPPPPAPAASSAAELIPADLDVVVRLDLTRIRQSLGGVALEALSRETLSSAGGKDDPGGLVLGSLLQAELVFLGFRPGPAWLPLDRVLSLQGRFEPLTAPPEGFSRATDLGGDMRYWERKPGPSPLARGETARVYALGERVRAFVSEAEIDSVERALLGLPSSPRLTPPEQGTLSVAARPLLASRLLGGDGLRELFGRAKQLSLVADLGAENVRFKLELELASAEDAKSLAGALDVVLARPWRASSLVDSVRVNASERYVSVVAEPTRSQLAGAIACLRSASPSECPW